MNQDQDKDKDQDQDRNAFSLSGASALHPEVQQSFSDGTGNPVVNERTIDVDSLRIANEIVTNIGRLIQTVPLTESQRTGYQRIPVSRSRRRIPQASQSSRPDSPRPSAGANDDQESSFKRPKPPVKISEPSAQLKTILEQGTQTDLSYLQEVSSSTWYLWIPSLIDPLSREI